jgi:hypothetical protein
MQEAGGLEGDDKIVEPGLGQELARKPGPVVEKHNSSFE